ncbi:MAG: hypothetical protein QG568_605 [Patescibacteria group bacterium]|nr:hypothetical protein [Patescibacteria group bacterium]
MKHALVTLLIVFIFVLIVVPLIYISLGKLKNPVDLFALSKISNSGAVTKQSNFISPNYIPESGSASKTQSTSEQYKKLIEDVDACFSGDSLYFVSNEYFSIEKKEGSKLNIKNNLTGTARFFDGFYPTAETEKSLSAKDNTMTTNSFIIRPDCAKNGTKSSELLSGFNDAGVLMDRMTRDDLQDYDFTNKGLTTINGISYYWYLFENKDRLYARPGDEVFYAAMYSAYYDNLYYLHTFEGSSLTYGTPRDFLNQTQTFLGGTVYGTSTAKVFPGYEAGRPSAVNGGGAVGSNGAVNANNSVNTQTSNTMAPAKYVPWTPAP